MQFSGNVVMRIAQFVVLKFGVSDKLPYLCGNINHYPMLRILFAPLQGYTEAPYRRFHQQVCGGVDTYYTPFIRLEHGQIRKKDLREALPEQNVGVHVVPQVIAADASEFVQLVEKLVGMGHREIDVNMGCPFPPQAKAGRGSGLLPHADRVADILSEVNRFHEEKEVQFSVKMRLGQTSPDECMALLPLLNAAPLSHITLHPRVGAQQYKGELDMEAFARFYEASAHPLVFNGMILSVEDIVRIEAQFPRLEGVMIGRGMLSRPTLAAEYAAGRVMNEAEVRAKVLELHRLLLAHYEEAIEGGEPQLVQKMHTFWEYLEPLFGHKSIKKILKSGNYRNYCEATSKLTI